MSINSHVLFTTSVNSDSNTANIWDYKTGNCLKSYKSNGNAAINSFQQLQNDYFIISDQNKPMLHLWAVNKQEEIKDVRLILPNTVCALAISPDNGYLTAAVSTKLYTWEISTGLLLSVVEKHLQPITCVKFAGYYLITASESGSVITFTHSTLISTRARLLRQVEPKYIRKDHTGSITDLYVGSFGVRSRFVTVSMDCTAIIYQAVTGEPLLKLVLNFALSCVLADKLFVNLFIGTNSGNIVQYSLREAPRMFTDHISSTSNELSFIGHKKCINCLDIHMNMEHLVSGSQDNFVYIWNIQSRTILNTIDLKGSVTNVKFIWNHANIHSEKFTPKFTIKPLRRDIDDEEDTNSIIIINNQSDIKV